MDLSESNEFTGTGRHFSQLPSFYSCRLFFLLFILLLTHENIETGRLPSDKNLIFIKKNFERFSNDNLFFKPSTMALKLSWRDRLFLVPSLVPSL